MSVTQVTTKNIISMDASKLTGAMPAMDGSNVTGVSSVMKSTSDPAIDTNPSGGVGTLWLNKTSGEMFALTDATTDANVWYNVGGGTGDVQPWTFQGSISGYTMGGVSSTTIDKFSLTSDANATDAGDLTVARESIAGSKSITHGYASGGGSPISDVIEKFTFAVDANSTDVGNLTVARTSVAGQCSATHGYTSGGTVGGTPASGNRNIIDKFTFASDANATDVGDSTIARTHSSSQTSTTHGYISGGHIAPDSPTNNIDKFPFASDSNATDVGDLTISRYSPSGQSSSTHGYATGGLGGISSTNDLSNRIDKFTFASDANATNVGNLVFARYRLGGGGQSSSTHGYTSGGTVGSTHRNEIEKHSFASDANATDVADLTSVRSMTAGTQN